MKKNKNPRICLLSLRHFKNQVFRSGIYEFEDLICNADDVECLTPIGSLEKYTKNTPSRIFFRQIRQHLFRNPGINRTPLREKYDVFLILCQQLDDLRYLKGVDRWKENCQISVCWIEEIWNSTLEKFAGCFDILKNFDFVMLNCTKSLGSVENIIGRKCFLVPVGIDTLRFCPYPNPPVRSIDVYNMGRRWPKTHEKLLQMADEGEFFYMYDTTSGFKVIDYREHRKLMSNILKRTKYFFVTHAKFDKLEETSGEVELASRFYEGAAAGSVLIGHFPDKEELRRKEFDWHNVLLEIPINTPDIKQFLKEYNSQPEVLEEIKKNNIINSLLRHDWIYRWKEILKVIGLDPKTGLIDREKRLKELAEIVQKDIHD